MDEEGILTLPYFQFFRRIDRFFVTHQITKHMLLARLHLCKFHFDQSAGPLFTFGRSLINLRLCLG